MLNDGYSWVRKVNMLSEEGAAALPNAVSSDSTLTTSCCVMLLPVSVSHGFLSLPLPFQSYESFSPTEEAVVGSFYFKLPAVWIIYHFSHK